MIKIHIISDLNLEYAQHVDPIEYEIPPDTNLIILNGNIGVLKRHMFHAEALALKYPDINVVCNLGQTERFNDIPKSKNELENSLFWRQKQNSTWPKNLHYSQDSMLLKLNNKVSVDILCVYGFPKIHSYEGKWEDTEWFKNYVIDVTFDIDDERVFIPEGVTRCKMGYLPIWATKDWINEQHYLEEDKVRKWEQTPTVYKILVTHINPYNDIRLRNITHSPYRIHLNNMLWVTSNQKIENLKFLGARLVSNPGLGETARSHVVSIDVE